MKRERRGRHRKIRILERLSWMLQVKDCRHVCLFCEYFGQCKAEGIPGKEDKAKWT